MADYVNQYGMKFTVSASTEQAKKEFQNLSHSADGMIERFKKLQADRRFAESTANVGNGMSGFANPFALATGGGLFGGKVGLFAKFNMAADAIKRAWQTDAVGGFKAAAASIAREGMHVAQEWRELAVVEGLDNRQQKLDNAKFNGALEHGESGAAIGAGLGLALGGPLGMAIGGALGLGGGAALGWFNSGKMEEAKQGIQQSQASIAYTHENVYRLQDRSIRASDFGYQQMMERAGGRTQRIDLTRKKLDEIENGEGQMSLKNLRKKYEQILRDNLSDTDWGREVKHNLDQQNARAESYRDRLRELQALPFATPQESGRYTDDLAKRGLYAGAQVDVMSVNDQILQVLKSQMNAYRKMSERVSEIGTNVQRLANNGGGLQ